MLARAAHTNVWAAEDGNRKSKRAYAENHPAQVGNLAPPEMAVRLDDGLCYLTSAIRASPTITSGIPLVNSRTLFLTQSAAFSL